MRTRILHLLATLIALHTLSARADITITGRTVDAETEKPLVGLVISATHLHADKTGTTPPFEATTQTGDDGDFSLSLPSGKKDYTILVRDADGRLRDGFTHIDEDTDLKTLKLSLLGECTGIVREANKPLVGVSVVAEMRLRKTSCKHYSEAARTKTDAEGAFAFASLSPGTYRCFIDDKRYAPKRQDVEIQDDFAYLELLAELGCTIEGIIHTTDKKPAPGIIVKTSRSRQATTDAQGHYSLSGLEKRSTTVSIDSDSYALAAGAKTRVEFKSGITVTRDFEVEPAATLRLAFTQEQASEMPSSVTVQLRGKDGWKNQHTFKKTLADESVTCTGLRSGTYSLHVHGDGVWFNTNGVQLTAGEIVELSLPVKKTVTVNGSVSDSNGDPIAKASVSLYGVAKTKTPTGGSYSSSHQQGKATTDETGAFVITGITPVSAKIEGKHKDYVDTSLELEITNEAEQEIHLVLEDACSITGAIVGTNGAAIAGAKLTVIEEVKSKNSQGRTSTSRRHRERGESDDDGHFSINGLAAGDYVLEIKHDDYCELKQEVTVTSGSNTLSNIELAAGLSISGMVQESKGELSDGIRVTANGPKNASGTERVWKREEVDADGSFEIGGLSEGRYTINIQDGRDTVSTLSDIEAGTDDIFVSLGAQHSVTGRVVDAEGNPLSGVGVGTARQREGSARFGSSGARQSDIETDSNGMFSVTVREGSPYRITASLSPYLPGNSTVDLSTPASFDNAVIEMTLKEGATIRGTVVDQASGAPVAGIEVRPGTGGWFGGMGMMQGNRDTVETTDSTGAFKIEGVAKGVVELMACSNTDGQRQVLTQKRVLVEADELDGVKIELPTTGRIEGVFITADGDPVSSASVMLQNTSNPRGMQNTQVDEDGSFLFAGVPAGTYQVYATPMNDDADSTDYTSIMAKMVATQAIVKEGETTTLSLRQKSGGSNETSRAGIITVNGTPQPGGKIVFQAAPKTEDRSNQMAMAMRMMGGVKQADIDEKGAFSITGLEPGEYTYRITDPTKPEEPQSGWMAPALTGTFTVEEGDQALTLAIDGKTLSGVVTAGGTPKEGIRMHLTSRTAKGWQEYTQGRNTVTDDEGKYALKCLQPGSYKLRTQTAEFSPSVAFIEVADRNVTHDITLSDGFTLRGQITNPEGNTLPQAAIVVLSPDTEETMGFGIADAAGDYTIQSPLPEGACLLLAFKDGYDIKTQRITLTEDTTWSPKLEPGGEVIISVKDASGNPVTGKYIEVHTKEGARVERCHNEAWAMVGYWSAACNTALNSAGSTTIKGLAPGTYAASLKGEAARTTFSVLALETTEVIIQQ
ncbi:MAG: hypothetical protein HN341_18265 [Verrucomicrobia bacterium]|jgi:protocatechuate 3,4-dioxygenase beta subunit|nr:hypothetical protein [Verrucomicrobiota bacterium]